MRRIAADQGPRVRILFEGTAVTAREGDSVAAALLAAGHWTLRRTAVSGQPRGPFCMMGVCFDCLVEVDGIPDRQACLTPVRDGMRVRRQDGAAGLADATSPDPRHADWP